MSKLGNNEQPKKKLGRPKTLGTMDDVFAETGYEIQSCEACGAKPATHRHYANGRVLCCPCSRPYFKKHINKLLGAGVLVGGFILGYIFF